MADPRDFWESLAMNDPDFWATHPSYGIPQFLDNTWRMYGGKPSDVAEQVRLGAEYMRARYGKPREPDPDQ